MKISSEKNGVVAKYKMSVMIESGLDISPVITHRLPYTEFQQGVDEMNKGEACKVILNWES